MSEVNSTESVIVPVTAIKDKTSESSEIPEVMKEVELVGPTGMKFARIQSPSSINTYKQCPRKYYFSYIEKHPRKPTIHTARGRAAHAALEHFFSLDIIKIPEENALFVLKVFINDMFKQQWVAHKSEFDQLDMDQTMLDYYFYETKEMINRWYKDFVHRLAEGMKNTSFVDAFKGLTPIREEQYRSEIYGVRGFIDAIHNDTDGVRIVDYKTSKRRKMSDAYRLQLGIYAMMYQEKHGFLPKEVGIFFLKHGALDMLQVDEELVNLAKLECELIHTNTQTKEKEDYPKKPGPLCKWRTGQCDFYGNCFGVKKF